jgi:hypothetical protein
MCGGLAGMICAEGLSCVDDPRHSCSYGRGDPDCSGLCV